MSAVSEKISMERKLMALAFSARAVSSSTPKIAAIEVPSVMMMYWFESDG